MPEGLEYEDEAGRSKKKSQRKVVEKDKAKKTKGKKQRGLLKKADE